MPIEIDIAVGLFGLLVAGAFLYAAFSLWKQPPAGNLDPRSQRLLRATGTPRLFDSLFARPLTTREKWGWAIVMLIIVLAIVFTGRN